MTARLPLKALAARIARGVLALNLVFALASPVVAQVVSPPPQATAAAPAAVGGDPALWVIRDQDSTLYLFGTWHMLRPGTAWFSPRVEAALAASSDVWLELPDLPDQATMLPLIRRHGVSPDRPLSHLLSTPEMGQLATAGGTIGYNLSQLDPLRPWYAAVVLSVATLVKAGYPLDSSVERALKALAVAEGKSLHGFETAEDQVLMMATLPEPVQVDFLRSTLNDFSEPSSEVDAMFDAWARGDVEALNRVVVQDMRTDSDAVYQAVIVRRNTAFADRIQGLLTGSGTAFIAVGAAHLAGEDSVQTMLHLRGVTVMRVTDGSPEG